MDDGRRTTMDRSRRPPAPTARHVLLAGGGSGGHVFPALAIADALIARGWRVSYAGSAQGLEARLLAGRDLPFYALPARPVVGRGFLARGRALLTLARSALAARRLVRRLEVAAVVGTGGYVAAPAVLGGWLARRPTLLFEPNARAGLANRALSRLASAAALAYPQTAAELRCPSTVTGVPVRRDFFAVPDDLPPAPPWRLLVLGGSQGARQLNELLPAALARRSAAAPPLSVHHQSGPQHVEATRAAYAELAERGLAVRVEPFVDDVAGAMARSHLVLSRAGAITLAELCAAGRPAILVPLALAGGHQRDNAAALEAAGAARLLAGDAATPAALAALLDELLAPSPSPLPAMARAARRLARRDAAARIAGRLATLLGEEG
ncbi:MAG: undecaprenyldiphospho-muramoylpentapeptide beta-N-acetylglucosaminyltransferase [Acidobacteria bacterium]|nr:MAG: undecaprenyldiphospho-muramoylpentapeptide beta-N-acetylglucosaminyltransferase [Acidobacteriota bacterium]